MKLDEKRILDIERIMPYNWKGRDGWLVRFNHYPTGKREEMKCHSKLFLWKKYSSPDEALNAARAYRDEWIEKNRDTLWLRTEGARYSAKLQANNTSGIHGVNRTTQTLKSGAQYSAWQASINQPDGTTKNHSFSTGKHGEIGAMLLAVQARLDGVRELTKNDKFAKDESIKTLIEYYQDILSNLEDAKNTESDSRTILEITNDTSISATAKYEEICIRIGQQKFRRLVLESYSNKCAITGASTLIRASHIKPWRHASNIERLDPMNGIALSPLYDAAFDAGMISFRPDGAIIICTKYACELSKLGLNENLRINNLKPQSAPYLAWHRKHIFKSSTPQANQSLE